MIYTTKKIIVQKNQPKLARTTTSAKFHVSKHEYSNVNWCKNTFVYTDMLCSGTCYLQWLLQWYWVLCNHWLVTASQSKLLPVPLNIYKILFFHKNKKVELPNSSSFYSMIYYLVFKWVNIFANPKWKMNYQWKCQKRITAKPGEIWKTWSWDGVQ